MSRIGKTLISIPKGVEALFADGVFTVKGPKGTLTRAIRNEISVTIDNNIVKVIPVAKTRITNSLWGTYASHIMNMMHGVTEGFCKVLVVEGIGYRVEKKENMLFLKVGFSHPVEIHIPQDLSVEVKDNTISVDGFDKEMVGEFAATVRAVKKSEPYKGKGIRYKGEIIRRKQGKKATASA